MCIRDRSIGVSSDAWEAASTACRAQSCKDSSATARAAQCAWGWWGADGCRAAGGPGEGACRAGLR
eukprot:7126052-Alexandrium_andersonii.AAC.1